MNIRPCCYCPNFEACGIRKSILRQSPKVDGAKATAMRLQCQIYKALFHVGQRVNAAVNVCGIVPDSWGEPSESWRTDWHAGTVMSYNSKRQAWNVWLDSPISGKGGGADPRDVVQRFPVYQSRVSLTARGDPDTDHRPWEDPYVAIEPMEFGL